MALYDYECRTCGYVTEVDHSIHASPEEVGKNLQCPKCVERGTSGGGFKRIITGANFTLKGSGWGRDGYK